jgi:hypothetical protein
MTQLQTPTSDSQSLFFFHHTCQLVQMTLEIFEQQKCPAQARHTRVRQISIRPVALWIRHLRSCESPSSSHSDVYCIPRTACGGSVPNLPPALLATVTSQMPNSCLSCLPMPPPCRELARERERENQLPAPSEQGTPPSLLPDFRVVTLSGNDSFPLMNKVPPLNEHH